MKIEWVDEEYPDLMIVCIVFLMENSNPHMVSHNFSVILLNKTIFRYNFYVSSSS